MATSEVVETYKQKNERRLKEKTEKAIAEARANPSQMDFWPNDKSVAPAFILRSSVFSVFEKGKRKNFIEKKLAAWGDTSITYTGNQLGQRELDVYLALIDLQKNLNIGDELKITEYRLLKILGLKAGGGNSKVLKRSLVMLTANCLEVKIGDIEYYGPLLLGGSRDTSTGELCVILHPEMAKLFGNKDLGGGVWQDKEQRRKLKSSLSKWLLGYINSHTSSLKEPHRVGLDKIRALSGSAQKNPRAFKQKVLNALKELQAVGALKDYGFSTKGVLEVIKSEHQDPRELAGGLGSVPTIRRG